MPLFSGPEIILLWSTRALKIDPMGVLSCVMSFIVHTCFEAHGQELLESWGQDRPDGTDLRVRDVAYSAAQTKKTPSLTPVDTGDVTQQLERGKYKMFCAGSTFGLYVRHQWASPRLNKMKFREAVSTQWGENGRGEYKNVDMKTRKWHKEHDRHQNIYDRWDRYLGEPDEPQEQVGDPLPRDGRCGYHGHRVRGVVVLPVQLRVQALLHHLCKKEGPNQENI